MNQIKTDPELLRTLQEAAKRRLTAVEIRQQRVDYIVATLSDEGTNVTKAQVENELDKLVGEAA